MHIGYSAPPNLSTSKAADFDGASRENRVTHAWCVHWMERQLTCASFILAERGARCCVLEDAARAILRPLDFLQKGRSMTWLADELWWMIVVEFQPSGFSKGFYLNVGCMCYGIFNRTYLSTKASASRDSSLLRARNNSDPLLKSWSSALRKRSFATASSFTPFAASQTTTSRTLPMSVGDALTSS